MWCFFDVSIIDLNTNCCYMTWDKLEPLCLLWGRATVFIDLFFFLVFAKYRWKTFPEDFKEFFALLCLWASLAKCLTGSLKVKYIILRSWYALIYLTCFESGPSLSCFMFIPILLFLLCFELLFHSLILHPFTNVTGSEQRVFSQIFIPSLQF